MVNWLDCSQSLALSGMRAGCEEAIASVRCTKRVEVKRQRGTAEAIVAHCSVSMLGEASANLGM